MRPPGQQTVDIRLTHGLCVWCGGTLYGSVHDLFCKYDHMEKWHAAVNGHPLPPIGPVPAEDAVRPMPPGAVPPHPNEEPWWRPYSDQPARTAEQELHRLLGTPSPAMYGALTGLLSDAECRQLEDDYPPRPGMYAPTPLRTGYGGDDPQLGDRAVPGYPFALEEIDPEPLPRTPWPDQLVADMQRRGFTIADQDSQVAPLRPCPRCGEVAVPAVRWGRWARLVREPSEDTASIMASESPRMFCSACQVHYPGPDLVPMIRAVPWRMRGPAYELAVVAGDYAYRYTVVGLPFGLGQVREEVWRTMWETITDELQPWGCSLPGCEAVPRGWYLLAAPMAWQGWLWQPSDGEPLRIGLCPRHGYELARTLYGDTRLRVDINPARAGRLAVY